MNTNRYKQFLEKLQETPPIPEEIFESIQKRKQLKILPYISPIAAMLLISLLVITTSQQHKKQIVEEHYFSYLTEEYNDFESYELLTDL